MLLMQPFISESDSFVAFSASMSCEAFAASTFAEEVESLGPPQLTRRSRPAMKGDQAVPVGFRAESAVRTVGREFSRQFELGAGLAGSLQRQRKTRYHSHLCANLSTDGWHLGAGISQTAEVLLLAIKNWQSQDMQRLIRA